VPGLELLRALFVSLAIGGINPIVYGDAPLGPDFAANGPPDSEQIGDP